MKDEQKEQGPTEKLRDDSSAAEKDEGVPGVEKSEASDIKEEKNPNTE